MTPDIRMDPRIERRIAEKKAALDLQRPLPAAIVTKLYADLRVRLPNERALIDLYGRKRKHRWLTPDVVEFLD